MAEIDVPDQGKIQVSQDDTIKDATGKLLSEGQQNSVKDHLISSGLMTEDGKPSEDVGGVFQKASNALSSFFAGDAPQGAKLPANNTTGQESSDASQEEVNTEPEKTKPAQKEDPERKDSGETSRSESKSDEDLKSEELGAEKGAEVDDVLDSPGEDAKSSETESKNDMSQEKSSHATGDVPEVPASSEPQPNDDEMKAIDPTEQEKQGEDGLFNEEHAKAEPIEQDSKVNDGTQQQPTMVDDENNPPKEPTPFEKGRSKNTKDEELSPKLKEESKPRDENTALENDDKGHDVSPEDNGSVKEDGDASANAQTSTGGTVADQKKPETEEIEKSTSPASDEAVDEEQPTTKSDSLSEEHVKEISESTGEPKKVDNEVHDASPKDIGELQDDGDSAVNMQSTTTDGEEIQPPKRASVHFDDAAKSPSEDTEAMDVEESARNDNSKDKSSESSAKSNDSQVKDEAPVKKKSRDKAEPRTEAAFRATPSKDEQPEQVLEEEEIDASPSKDDGSKQYMDENASPKTETAAVTEASIEDVKSKVESRNEEEPESSKRKNISDEEKFSSKPDTPIDSDSTPQDDTMPNAIGELKSVGDTNANSQPDGTNPEPPRVAKESAKDRNGTEPSTEDKKAESDDKELSQVKNNEKPSPSTQDNQAEGKRNIEPSHPEAQEPPEQHSVITDQASDAPHASLLDGVVSSRTNEVEKYEQPNASSREQQRTPDGVQSSQIPAEDEYDDASGAQPSSDQEEVTEDSEVKDSKYGNQTSSNESSESSQTKQPSSSISSSRTLTETISNATETIADTRRDILDAATNASKYSAASAADGIKDNAPEKGKEYTNYLKDVITSVTDKAADLNQSYQDRATDGTKRRDRV